MSVLVTRLILAMLIFPISVGLWVAMMSAFFYSHDPTIITSTLTWFVEYTFIATYWLFLWRKTVRWTPERVKLTWLVTGASIFCGAIASAFIETARLAPPGLGTLAGGAVVPILWVFGTVLAWKETSEERLERLKTYGTDAVCCPTCGYNMTGLREARCPECGGQFTIDELLTAQHEREQELEQS